jgi:hypothetical protein
VAFRSLGWLFVLSACSTRTAAVVDAAPDVAPDADPCASPYVLTPIAVAGTSPRGPFDIFHYVAAGHVNCPDAGIIDAYGVYFFESEIEPNCASSALTLWIMAPYSTGTNDGRAVITVQPGALTDWTDKVTFEATQLDPPDATSPHIVGHFVSQPDPVWSFDVAVDLISQVQASCL